MNPLPSEQNPDPAERAMASYAAPQRRAGSMRKAIVLVIVLLVAAGGAGTFFYLRESREQGVTQEDMSPRQEDPRPEATSDPALRTALQSVTLKQAKLNLSDITFTDAINEKDVPTQLSPFLKNGYAAPIFSKVTYADNRMGYTISYELNEDFSAAYMHFVRNLPSGWVSISRSNTGIGSGLMGIVEVRNDSYQIQVVIQGDLERQAVRVDVRAIAI